MPTFEMTVQSLRQLLEEEDDIDAIFDDLTYNYLTTHQPKTVYPKSNHNRVTQSQRLPRSDRSGSQSSLEGRETPRSSVEVER
jgi:hypothetical protein